MLRRLILFFLFLFPAALFGKSRIECSALKSTVLNRAVRYCVVLPDNFQAANRQPSTQRYPVLYFLHGLGNDEQTLFSSSGWNVIEDLREQRRIGDFFVVAPEGGRSFFINSADGKTRYSDFFLKEFIPYVERKYPIRAERRARAISGVSMGGYGALRHAFAHPELFGSVSAESPALIPASPSELNAAIQSGTPLGNLLGQAFGTPINGAHWQANDPMALARRNAARLRRLAIYFNCGQSDNLGFDKGARALHRELQSLKIAHEYHLYPGDHSLEYFLTHLGEAMEFHWKAFGQTKR